MEKAIKVLYTSGDERVNDIFKQRGLDVYSWFILDNVVHFWKILFFRLFFHQVATHFSSSNIASYSLSMSYKANVY